MLRGGLLRSAGFGEGVQRGRLLVVVGVGRITVVVGSVGAVVGAETGGSGGGALTQALVGRAGVWVVRGAQAAEASGVGVVGGRIPDGSARGRGEVAASRLRGVI